MKRYMIFALLSGISLLCFGITLNVAIDGSGQYSSIQSAIEAANNGDTVLVYPGRYIENIDYLGKSLNICSLEAMNGDSSYISQTIIDGNRNGSCVAFRNAEQNASLRGFTLTNGTGISNDGIKTKGGGIHISNSYMTGSSISLTNCEITGNYGGMGGGIYSKNASLHLSGLNVHHNYSLAAGGGIAITGGINSTMVPNIVFDPVNRCSVYENYGAAPVDVSVIDIRANLTIYLDKASINPISSFYIGRHNNLSNQQHYHDTVNAQRAHRNEINRDFYVSPHGDDNNSGVSPNEPMRSITRAMHLIASDSLNVKTVHILPGVYEEAESEQIYPIPIKDYTNLIGAGSESVTLTSSVFCTLGHPTFINANKAKHNTISGFTMTESVASNRNPFATSPIQDHLYLNDVVISDIQNCSKYGIFVIDKLYNVEINKLVFKNITTQRWISHMYAAHSTKISNSCFTNLNSTFVSDDPLYRGIPLFDYRVVDSFTIENTEFSNISVLDDQMPWGIDLRDSGMTEEVNIRLSNCLFDNIRTNDTRAIIFGSNNYSNFEVSNCTFYNNYASVAVIGIVGNVTMRNNIFYNPDAEHDIQMYPPSQHQSACNLDLDYNYIYGGEDRIYNHSTFNSLSYGEHNQSAGPLFASTNAASADYLRLAPDSACINAGTPDITGLGLLPYDLAGNYRVWGSGIDLGCYEYGSEPWVSAYDPVLPVLEQLLLQQNYPNPFNPSTTIQYSLPKAAKLRLDIFNVKGQLVKTLVNSEMPAGTHSVVWNGRDMENKAVATGVYFYRISSPKEGSITKKMMLMK